MKKKRLLIIEDSIYITTPLKILFEKNNLDVEVVNDSTKAFDVARKGDFDLIILDLMMPEVSGEDIFELLKDDKKTKKIPVLILTARKNALKFDKNLEKCDLFFSKPFNNNELLTEVKKLVKIS